MGLTHRELGSNATAGVAEALIERLAELSREATALSKPRARQRERSKR